MNEVKLEKMEAVRNHAPRGWVIRLNGNVVGPLCATRKEAASWATSMGYIKIEGK